MTMPMTGRSALVTGASKGIGFAIAGNFALAGANVALVARDASTLEAARAAIEQSASGVKLAAISADVSTAEGCGEAFAKAEQAFGRIDVLVNNAGTSAAKPFADVTDEEWQADLDLKLFAAIRLARLAYPKMVERRWGRIINILNSGAKAPRANSTPTSVSRAAGLALTKALANEGAPHNVLVNSLHVGLIESDQWVRRANGSSEELAKLYANMGKNVPMGRIGTAEEFANVALFLASDAGSYVTGTAINIDGGMTPVT
ncbi:MAG: SDR family oxidoreductase [Hyphomicrobiales bacterium]|nr:SDR family oxidoreductase [Hyphomicrobiales bacterium]